MSKLPSYTVADLSTAHMTKRDSELLTEDDMNNPFIVHTYEFGFFVYGFSLRPEVFKSAKEHGYSDVIIAALKQAAVEGHKYVNFDCDGYVIPELPTSEW